MSKKKKNNNYVTAKTIYKKEQQEKALKAKRTRAAIIASAIVVSVIVGIAGIIVGLGFAFNWWGPKVTHHASIEVEGYGTIHLELYGEEAPITVKNFVHLAESGFYNGLTFHRIIEGFMVQGGDPDGNGTGGSGNNIPGEFALNGYSNSIKHERGVISMARSETYNSASSQFFIMQKAAEHLDGSYAAFGRVTSGIEIVDQLCADATPTDNNGSIAPAEQPVIKSITIHGVH